MRISDWSSDVCSSDLDKGAEGRTAEQAPGQFPAVLFGIRARGCHNIPQSLAKKGLRATELVRAGVDIANRSTRRRREAIRTMDEKDGTPVLGGPGSRTSSYPPGAIQFVRRPSTRPSLGVRRRLIKGNQRSEEHTSEL